MQATIKKPSAKEKRTADAMKAFARMPGPMQLYIEGIARGVLLAIEDKEADSPKTRKG
jgi:hypothetical protein